MVSRFEDFQRTSLDFQQTSLDLKNKISKQFSELMAVLNRSRDDKLCDDRPDPKPIYEIKADKEIPKVSSKSKRRYKLQKRISCEELDERTMKGLCVFCEEPETPGHYLQHMNSCLLMIDSEDHLSDSMVNKIGNEISSDKWLSNSIGCELEIDETDNDEDRGPSDSDLVVNDMEKVKKDLVGIEDGTVKREANAEVEKKTVTENREGEVVTDKEPMEVDTSEIEHKTESGGRAEEPPKSAADEVHVQSIEPVVRDQAQEARSDVVSSPEVSVTRVGAIKSQPCISGRANHVWKPGELEQVMVIDDVVSLGKHVKLSDCVALPLITPSSSVLQVFSHANRSVWEPGGFHCVQVQENRVQHERNKAEGVEFVVQRIGVASEMENQTVTAVGVYDKRSDRVWEPGGLPTKLNMRDWTEQHPRQGDVFEFEADLLEEIIQQDENSERHSFHKRQQVKKLRLSSKPWLFKFKQKQRKCPKSWVWHWVKRDTQQTDFHVWHRWKNKAEKLEVSLVCSGKRWSFVVYAFYDHTMALRKEQILSLKIKRGFENKIMAGMSRGQSVKQHNGRDSENAKLYNNNIKRHYTG